HVEMRRAVRKLKGLPGGESITDDHRLIGEEPQHRFDRSRATLDRAFLRPHLRILLLPRRSCLVARVYCVIASLRPLHLSRSTLETLQTLSTPLAFHARRLSWLQPFHDTLFDQQRQRDPLLRKRLGHPVAI